MTRGAPIPETVTLHVPFRIVKRGGRKEMHLPEGATHSRRTDSTLVKALARAFRWKRMQESGEFATISEVAEREGIAPSYMTRILRLTLLAPDIVEAILGGKQGPEVTLARVLEPFSARWEEQLVQCTQKDTTGVELRAYENAFAAVQIRRCGFLGRCAVSEDCVRCQCNNSRQTKGQAACPTCYGFTRDATVSRENKF